MFYEEYEYSPCSIFPVFIERIKYSAPMPYYVALCQTFVKSSSNGMGAVTLPAEPSARSTISG
jgi:hypothetical protein